MAVYTVYNDFYVCVVADSQEEAIQKAEKIMKKGGGISERICAYNEETRYIACKNMLKVLKEFHGSDCEKEFLDIREAFKNERKSVAYRKLEDFIEKGEYKKYNIEPTNYSIIIYNNDKLDFKEDWNIHEAYEYEGPYDVAKDIEDYKKQVLKFDNAIKEVD